MVSPHKGPVTWTTCLLTCLPEGTAEQSVDLPVTRDAMAPMWRQCKGFGKSNDSIQKAICRKSRWRHQMETFSDFPRYWPFARGNHRSPVKSPRKGQWRGALMFSLIRAWTKSWVNNGDAGDLRRHRAHCDVDVMVFKSFSSLYALQPQVCQVCASCGNKSLSSLWITSCFPLIWQGCI